VTKKAPNVLDKSKVGGSGASAAGSGRTSVSGSAPSTPDVDIKKLTMVVMDEVQKQMGEIASKQKERIDEMGAEIRKLKAMIVKHESRIRTLETKNRDLESQVVSSGGGGGGVNSNGNNGGSAGSEEEIMGPDEV